MCSINAQLYKNQMSLWLTQATDEDSPPNNVLTYSIVYASQFRSFFSITMVEGYAGM